MKWLRNRLFPDLVRREALADEISTQAERAIELAEQKPPVIIRGQVFEDTDPLYLGRLAEIGRDPVFQYFLAQVREVHIDELSKMGRSGDTALVNNLCGRLQQIEEIRVLLAVREREYQATEEAKRV